LDNIFTGDATNEQCMSYSEPLQKLYIWYVQKMTGRDIGKVLGPRAFFIYISNRIYVSQQQLEKQVLDMVKNYSIMDTHPTEYPGGKHTIALRIFSCT